MAPVAGKLAERGRRRREQRLVEPSRGGGDEAVERVRQREHQVEVRHRQHFALARREPGLFRPHLTAWAMPVAAGVIDMTASPAGIAGYEVAAEGLRAAGGNRPPRLGLCCRQPVLRKIRRAEAREHLGQPGRLHALGL